MSEPGIRWPVRAERVLLGAGEATAVPRVAEEVPGCRAELALHDGVWLVSDLGSASIRVDGEPLTGAAPLAPGSTIRCGELEAVFLPHDRWTATPAAPAPAPEVDAPRAAAPAPIQAPLFAAMPASAPRRMPTWLLLSLVAVAAIAAAAFFILRSR